MARICVITRAATLLASEEFVRDMLIAAGHTVTMRPRGDGPVPDPETLFDLFYFPSSMTSSYISEANFTANWIIHPQVNVFVENHVLAQWLGLADPAVSTSAASSSLNPYDAEHPLVLGKGGSLVPHTHTSSVSMRFFPTGTAAPGATRLWASGSLANDRMVAAYFDAGDTVWNLTQSPNRRMYYGFNNNADGNTLYLNQDGRDLMLAAVTWAAIESAPPPENYQYAYTGSLLQNPGGWVDHEGGTDLLTTATVGEDDDSYIQGTGAIEFTLTQLLTAAGRFKRIRARKDQPGGNAVNLLVEVRDPAGTTVLSSHLVALSDSLTTYSVPVNASTYSGNCRVRFTATQA
jgi:hypothetical protein